MSSKSPEILTHTPEVISPENLQKAREALAKRWGMTIDQIPDDSRILKFVDKSLDDLSSTMKGQENPLEKARILKEKLATIDQAEALDKARELGKDGKKLLQSEVLAQSVTAIQSTTEKLKTEGLAHGKEAAVAVGAIVGAKSIGEATDGINSLSKVIDATGNMVSSAMKHVKDMFSGLFKMFGLDKLFKSIGGLFGMKFADEEKPKENIGVSDNKESSGVIQSENKPSIETREGRNKFIEKLTKSFGSKISNTYFGGKELSNDQIKKIYSILDKNFNAESLTKVADRLEKGEIQIGEMADAVVQVGGAYPTRVMWELAFSGIIPFWAISQHVILNPAGNLIKLTFDGLGFPVSPISLDQFGSILENESQLGNTHAMDMARIQLYGVNSVLFRTIGELLGTTVAAGIMLSNTTSGVDGLKHLAKSTNLKQFDKLSGEFGRIESILARGSGYGDKVGAFTHMLDGVRDLRVNALLMDAVSKNTINGKLDHEKIIKSINSLAEGNPDFKHINTQALRSSINNENAFRDNLKNLIKGPSSSASWRQSIERSIEKFGGGRTGEALRYLDRIDSVKKWQQSLMGDVGMLSEKMKRLGLAYDSLKLARSGDTVILHMENMDDISKFRAFISTIPGGIRAISEIIPAASLAISLGSVAWDSRDKKDGTTGESIMDILKTGVFPAYGTWGIIRDKTVNFGQMISNHEMPDFSDIAFTGVVGGVFVYEITRVGRGLIDISQGNIAKGVSKLTYLHDIGRGIGQITRGGRNIAALATKPALRPELTKTLGAVASKMPKKGRLAIGAGLLLAAGGAYAYFSNPDTPEEIAASLQKDGLTDQSGNPTEQAKKNFYLKTPEERKELLDAMLMVFLGKVKDLPKTHYDPETGKYALVLEKGQDHIASELIDSTFRKSLQLFGADIEFPKVST